RAISWPSGARALVRHRPSWPVAPSSRTFISRTAPPGGRRGPGRPELRPGAAVGAARRLPDQDHPSGLSVRLPERSKRWFCTGSLPSLTAPETRVQIPGESTVADGSEAGYPDVAQNWLSDGADLRPLCRSAPAEPALTCPGCALPAGNAALAEPLAGSGSGYPAPK